VQKLSGGAHLLLPSSDSTIAVRAYFAKDLETKANDDLASFRNAFKYPICFFILPCQKPLSDMNSFVIRAQRVMNNLDQINSQQKVRFNGYMYIFSSWYQTHSKHYILQEGSAHVYIVPDVASAVTILSTVVQSLTPKRRELKRKFCETIQSRNFCDTTKDAGTAALHVTGSFRAWARRFQLSTGAADVLMGRLKSLGRIASADRTVLDRIAALDESSKTTLQEFFGSSGPPRSIAPLNSTRAQKTQYLTPPPPYGAMNAAISQAPQQETHFTPPRYQASARSPSQASPQDSIVGMMQAQAAEQSMGFSQVGEWETPPFTQLLTQQYVPAGRPMHSHRGSMQYRATNVASQGLLHQANPQIKSRNGRIGSLVRPMSSYSAASWGHPPQGYYR
jgi:hypothetical protein